MTERKPEFIAIIGDRRIPTSANVIATYLRTQGKVPFKYEIAGPQKDARRLAAQALSVALSGLTPGGRHAA